MKSFICIFLLVVSLSGNSFPQKNLSQIKYLTDNADIILTGKVTGKTSEWTNNKTSIISKITISASEYLKGSSGDKILVTCLGGEVNGVGELYTHLPVFNIDEDVLLFLRKDRISYNFVVLGGEAGKVKLSKEQVTNNMLTGSSVKLSTLKEEIMNFLENKN